MRDKEREGTHTHSREGCHGRQTNKIVFFCLVIGNGTQTDQWWSASIPRPNKGG